jgi:hypothetical protein
LGIRAITKISEKVACPHGHRFFADLIFGATASKVQQNVSVPVLLLRAK